MAGVTATAGLNLMGPRAAAVSTFMRRRLASLLTEGRMLTSAAALTPAGASLLAELFSTATLDAAGSIGLHSLKAEDVAAPAAAFAAFVGATSVDVKADLGGWQVTIDEWHAAHASLALASWVSRVLNQKTSDLILGRMTKHAYVAENTRAAISLRLQETAESKATADGLSIRVMCLDPKASTYSPHGELHQQSQCMYSESETVKAFLSMDGAEWAYFILSCTSAAWLIMTLSVSLTAILHVLPRIKARNAAPVESWPHVAVLVPCYMPNEQTIIEETLERICSQTSYQGKMDVHVPYNTPKSLPIEAELAKRTELHGCALRCERVIGSTSKAHNLEYALKHMVGDASIVVIFDADHHPRAHTIENLVRTLVHHPQFTMAQGAVLVERGGYPPLRWLVDGMEWASWHFWGPGLSLLAGSAYFGGGNAAWRREALEGLGFDSTMLTEDIDVSIRALSLGHRMQFVPWAQVGELCPATFTAFYKQRLRWAMGWEQVTAKRIGTLFNSTAIPESRKWRTSVLLVARYWAILGSLVALANLSAGVYFEMKFGERLERAAPIERASSVSFASSLLALSFLFVSLRLNREPWWRWVHVAMFIPLGMPYVLCSCLLMLVSWVKLSCFDLEWVPTARHAGAEIHSIKMEAHTGEYNTFAPTKPLASDEEAQLLGRSPKA